MSLRTSRLAVAVMMGGALSLAAVPAQAVEQPRISRVAYAQTDRDAGASETYDHSRRWRRDRIDAGDVLAGVLVIGAIAAIANSGRKSEPPRDVRYEPRYDDRYRDRGDDRSQGGIDSAVDMCVGQVERGPDRVATVDEAARRADGWRVSGQIEGGEGFSCWIDNEGRIRSVDIGNDYPPSYEGADATPLPQSNQYSDDYYARARADQQRGDYRGPVAAESGAIDGDLKGAG